MTKCVRSASIPRNLNRARGSTLNVERLNTIANALKRELASLGVQAMLQRVVNGLENMIGQPQAPQFQQEVGTGLTDLRQALEKAPSNDFPASWRQTLEELNLDGLFGVPLRERVDSLIEANQLTPSVALDGLRPILERLALVAQNLDLLSETMAFFEIASEEDLEPGAVELSVLIPRGEVNNELSHLGQEFVQIERMVWPFTEVVADGSRPNLQVRAIASSDFGVYVHMPLEVGVLFAGVVAYLMTQYKTLLEIRKLHQELADNNVPPERLQGITDHADDLMRTAIEKEVARVTEGLDRGGRENELKIQLTRSVTDIALRIDRGFSIDIRVAPVGPLDDEANGAESETAANLAAIQDLAPALKFIRPAGRPILTLLAGGRTDEEGGVDSGDE